MNRVKFKRAQQHTPTVPAHGVGGGGGEPEFKARLRATVSSEPDWVT